VYELACVLDPIAERPREDDYCGNVSINPRESGQVPLREHKADYTSFPDILFSEA
jgi:hypothetical protein